MPRVAFTPHLQRFLDAPPVTVTGATVGEVLERVFETNPRLRGYVLDEHGRVRQHVAVFVGESPLVDRVTLADAVGPETEVFVLQALSGGAAAMAAPGEPR